MRPSSDGFSPAITICLHHKVRMEHHIGTGLSTSLYRDDPLSHLPANKAPLKQMLFGQFPNATKSIKTPLGAGLYFFLSVHIMHQKSCYTYCLQGKLGL